MERQVDRPQLWPPPAIHRADPPPPLLPSPAPPPPQSRGERTLPLFSCSHHENPPSVWEPEGEDTCDQKPVTWQPSQKASMPVARQGAGIYFPSSAPRFILEAPSPTREPKRNPLSLLSQLPPSSRVRKTIFHKRERTNFLSFCPSCRPKVLFIALPCVIPVSTHRDSFWWEKKKKTVKPYLFCVIIVSTLANVQLQFRYYSHIQRQEKRWKYVCEVVEFRFRSWGTLGSLCISIRPYFSQTAKAACILSQPVFDQLPVASQYVGMISSEVFKWVTFGLKDARSCAHTHDWRILSTLFYYWDDNFTSFFRKRFCLHTLFFATELLKYYTFSAVIFKFAPSQQSYFLRLMFYLNCITSI